jgi:prophage DNA circulation protein
MALLEVLRVTCNIRNGVKVVDGKVESVENKVEVISGKVEDIGDKVQGVHDKVQVVINGAQGLSGRLLNLRTSLLSEGKQARVVAMDITHQITCYGRLTILSNLDVEGFVLKSSNKSRVNAIL